jgi:hypothetical protein
VGLDDAGFRRLGEDHCIGSRHNVQVLCFADVTGGQENWLRVLGTAEPPQIDQHVGHQLHPLVPLLDVLETEQQPFAFVIPRKHPFHTIS